ncbi:MAG: hypothetical protein WCB04_05490 [Mycobacteriales bacterium]
MAQGKRAEHIERAWPNGPDEHPVAELVGELQGADRPYGELELPLPLERHGKHWVIREPGTERRDTDFGGDEGH